MSDEGCNLSDAGKSLHAHQQPSRQFRHIDNDGRIMHRLARIKQDRRQTNKAGRAGKAQVGPNFVLGALAA